MGTDKKYSFHLVTEYKYLLLSKKNQPQNEQKGNKITYRPTRNQG